MSGPVPIGRNAQRRVIVDALRRSRQRTAQVVVVTGEAGSGKTTLLEDAVGTLGTDVLLLRAAGHTAESDIPYAGLHQLLLPVKDTIDALQERHRRRLRRALAEDDGTPADTLTTANSLLTLIAALAEFRPVVIVVDDMQWLDPSSRQALVFVARRLDADAVCFLFSTRPESGGDVARMGTRVEVGPLDPADAHAVLRRTHPDLSAIVRQRIVEHAGGHPLALAEIPAELTDGQRSGTEPLPARIPIGPTLEGLYERRLAELPGNERMAVLLASFDDLDPDRLRRALDLRGLSVADYDIAERSSIVRIVDGRCVFPHPTVRAAVRNAATAAELVTAHTTLAECNTHDPIRYAYHLQRVPGADPVTVVEAVVNAASQAMRQGGWVEAADAWAAAGRISTADDRARFLHEAVTCYVRAGAGPQAAVLLREMIDGATDDADRARYVSRLVALMMWAPAVSMPDDADLLPLGAKLAGTGTGHERAAGLDLLLALTVSGLTSGDYRAAGAAADAMRHAVPMPDLPLDQQLVCDVVDVMTGADNAGAYLRSDWVDRYPWRRISDPSIPVGTIGAALGWIDELDACAAIARRCRELADEGGFLAAQLAAGSVSAIYEQAHGRWDRVRLEYAASEALALDSDFSGPYPFIALRHAYLLAAQGRAAECRRLQRRAREVAPTWTPAFQHLDQCVSGLLHLSLGEFTASADALDAAAAAEEAMGSVVSGYTSRFADRFQAYWHLGRAHELEPELAVFEEAAERVRHPTMTAEAARCRALLVPDADMDEAFSAVLARHADSTDVFAAARTRLLWGQRLRRARRKSAARAHLNEALTVFENLEAVAWLDTCRSELAACGERRIRGSATTTGPIATLTPREYDVAREVSRGVSNAQAAERLFVSERTVEFHLSNAYRKLGVTRRAGLAELFAGYP